MKKTFLAFIYTLFFLSTYAQPSYQWAFAIGSNQTDRDSKICVDASGNVFVTGYFRSIMDFDPGPGVASLTALSTTEDIFIAKYNSAGVYQWAFSLGGSQSDRPLAIAIDNLGDIVVTGYFSGTSVDFDPGAGSKLLSSPTNVNSMFFAKYTSAGNLAWAFTPSSTFASFSQGNSIFIDASNTIYFTGQFAGSSYDFDPSAGTASLVPVNLSDAFVAKYSAGGSYLWAFNIGGNGNDYGLGVTVDASSNVYVTGAFTGPSVDCDPGVATATLTNVNPGYENIFVSKYSSAGTYLSSFGLAAFLTDHPTYIKNDASGNIILGGYFNQTIDFDPGAGTANLTAPSSNYPFIAKYDPSLNYIWASLIPGTVASICTDAMSNITVCGNFSGTSDFDLSSGVSNLISSGSTDGYVAKYTPSSGLISAFKCGGTNSEDGCDIAISPTGELFFTGNLYSTSADFDPGPGVVNIAPPFPGGGDIFLSKYQDCISAPAAPGAISGNTLICEGSNTTYSVSAVSGASSYLWSLPGGWSGTSTTNSISVLAGSISGNVTITAANGCGSSATQNLSVTVNPAPIITINSGTICSGQSFIMLPSGANTYTFSSGTATVYPLTNTSYSVTGTSSAGCISQIPGVSNVTVNPTPTISVNSGSICSGQNFVMSPSGASSYTFSSGTATVNPSSSTSYSVTGTSSAGCISSASGVSNVTVNPTPTISVNSGSICSGQNFVMTPTGASTYTYSSGTATVNPSSSTSYSVTGTSVQGCVSANPAVASITVNANPVANAGSSQTITCLSNTVTLNGTGLSVYTWNGPGIVSGGNTANPIVNMAGTYSLYGSTGGCNSNTATVLVTTNTIVPTVSVTASNSTMCNGSSSTLTAGGANSYTWSTGSNSMFIVVTPSSSIVYTVTGINSVNGCINTATQSITVNPTPTITVNSGTICAGQNFVMTPLGASTYTFSGGSATVNPVSNTSYTINGTSSAGCVSSVPAVSNVTVSPIPSITVNNGTICSGQSFTIVPGGASTYTIQGGSTIVSPTANSIYTVAGTSSAGCTSALSATASVTVSPTPTITVNSGSICSGSSFTMSPIGASTYTFSSGSSIVSPTTSTSYSVTGTGSTGCVSAFAAVSDVTVFANPVITVNSGSVCSGSSFTMVPTGAITYTYSSGSAIVSPAINTSYSVSGTSSAGCVSSSYAVSDVTVVTTPTANAGASQVITCSNPTVTLSGSGVNTYTWSGPGIVSGTNSAICTVTAGGTYSLSGSSSGCTNANTATVSVTTNTLPPTITINTNPIPTTICAGNSATLIASGANSYTWNTGSNATSIIVSPTVTASYSVNGTSLSNGCAGSNTQLITVNPTPTITVNSGAICIGQSFTISPGGANTYTFSSGPVVSPTTTSSYSIIGTSSAGCVSSSPAVSIVTVNPLPTITANTSNSIICGPPYQGTATLNASGASTYTWNTSAITSSISVSPSVTTQYTVIGTDSNGCENTAIITQSVSACTEISELSTTDHQLSVYPNPTSGSIILIVSPSPNQTSVEIFNSVGERVYTVKSKEEKLTIDLSALTDGIYFIKAGDKIQKIIKNQ